MVSPRPDRALKKHPVDVLCEGTSWRRQDIELAAEMVQMVKPRPQVFGVGHQYEPNFFGWVL